MVEKKQQTSEHEAAEREAPEADERLEGPAAVEPAEDGIGIESDADLAERLAAAEAERDKFKDEYLRALAEAENVRRRAARDKSDAGKYAISAFARDLLPVSDNLRRAVDSVDPKDRDGNPAFESLIAGVEMTERELLTVFERYGIKPIPAMGEPFDPHVHEAMFEVPDESVPNGTVMHVLEPGFMIHDRPLRATRVGVSKGGPKRGPEETESAESQAETGASVEPLHKGSAAAYEKQSDSDLDPFGSHLDEKF